MWIIAFMAALMMGTAFSSETSVEETETDTADASPSDDEDMQPVAPLPDAMDEDTPESDPIPVVETGETFEVFLDQSATGTDGNDRFELIEGPRVASPDGVSITGGAGDDVIALLDPDPAATEERRSFDYFYERALIDGGAGNDMITVSGSGTTITGGAGDDTIELLDVSSGSLVQGGEGNDTIGGRFNGQDSARIEGGAGNDVIDARGMENAAIFGDDGNDRIFVSGSNPNGTGYVVAANGGAGNDTISFEGESTTDPSINTPLSVSGGSDSDTFELSFSEGDALPSSNTPISGPAVLDVITLDDFEPGVDTIEVELLVENSAFIVEGARLEEDSEAGTTRLIFSYDSDTEVDREVVVLINAVGVSFDDISFVGFDEATLTGSRSTS